MASRISPVLVLMTVLLVAVSMATAQERTTQREERREVIRESVTTRETTTRITEVEVATPVPQAERLVAIFVRNRSAEPLDDKLGMFEDLLVSELTGMGFRVMSRGDTIRAVRSYLATEEGDPLPGEKLDATLDNSTSALALARNMGADFLLVAAINSFGVEEANVSMYGVDETVTTGRMRGTYKFLGAGQGESVLAGRASAEKKVRQAPGFSESSDAVNDLIEEIAMQIADNVRKKGEAAALPEPSEAAELVNFRAICGMGDVRLPEVRVVDGEYLVTESGYTLEAMAATVEIDGVAIGTTGGELQARPGLAKIRITREGFRPWERVVNIHEGLNLDVALEMDSEGMARWRDNAAFLANLRQGEKLTNAEVERLEAVAEMLRQSGYRVDIRSMDAEVRTSYLMEDRETADRVLDHGAVPGAPPQGRQDEWMPPADGRPLPGQTGAAPGSPGGLPSIGNLFWISELNTP